MQKILIASPYFPLKKRPIDGIFVAKEAELMRQFFEVKVIVTKPIALPGTQRYVSKSDISSEYPSKIAKYVSIPGRRLHQITQLMFNFFVIRHLISLKPNIVHLHFLYPSALGLKKLAKSGQKCIITCHGSGLYDSMKLPSLMRDLGENLSFADGIICVGNKLKNDFINVWPHLAEKIHVVNNHVDTTFFSPGDLRTAQNELGWDSSKIHALTVGNIQHAKGLDTLVNAIAINEKLHHIQFHIIAAIRDAALEIQLNDLIVKHNLTNITLYSAKTKDELLTFYRASNFYVQPSRSETFGIALAEAICCGIPAVATRSGGPEEIISKEVGLLVTPDSPHDLSSALDSMSICHNNYNKQELHAYICNNYSAGIKLLKIKELYEKIEKS